MYLSYSSKDQTVRLQMVKIDYAVTKPSSGAHENIGLQEHKYTNLNP